MLAGDRIAHTMGGYAITAATSFGPRVTSLSHRAGPDMLAQLDDDVAMVHPDLGSSPLHGGHRLWAGPEVPEVTYAPDAHECEVRVATDRLTITAPRDAAGLSKAIELALDGGRLIVDHRLTNALPKPLSVAAWGITQMRLGGTALMPIGGHASAPGLQGDRSLVLWPYTNLSDHRLTLHNRMALVQAVAGPRLKLGTGPAPGRLGYMIDGFLFTKEVARQGPGSYPDLGAVGQVFVDDSSCELESVGPICSLGPGDSVTHREVWEITACPDVDEAHRRLSVHTE